MKTTTGGRRFSIPHRVAFLAKLATSVFFLGLGISTDLLAQEPISPLPPPVTRGLYRSHWFEFLNAHLEDDPRAASIALQEMKKAARGVGVRRLSDFARTAVHEGRKAEALGRMDRAARAYAVSAELDDANFSGTLARIRFLLHRRAYSDALRVLPESARALFATHESRQAAGSQASVCAAVAIVFALAASIIVLLLRHFGRFVHDLRETAERWGARGGATPMALVLLAVPLALGFGPVWTVLFWGALVCAYASRPERVLLAAGLILTGLLGPYLQLVARENIVRRSPLYVAAVDLQERREDGSAEDGLRQASAVFAEDPDVWFLLGIYAERAGDSERAVAAYDRAIQTNPNDYRPFLNRGNVHFQDGDYPQAIRDYDAASQRAPKSPEVYYNLSIARGEAYDFDGQGIAMARARQLSDRDVSYWADHPTLARVVPASYPLSRARRKIEQWNAQPKSRRLPGHVPPYNPIRLLFTPLTILPWTVLFLGAVLASFHARHGLAAECLRCGKPFCAYCKQAGEPPLYCTTCVRSRIRKEPLGIEGQVAYATQLRERTRRKDFFCRLASLLFPGTHRFFSEKPASGFLTLFLFFFCVAAAGIGAEFFDPRELPPPGQPAIALEVALVAAFLIWVASIVGAWRGSHGS